jgi:ATP-dependent DNA helicase HFM1/MER3
MKRPSSPVNTQRASNSTSSHGWTTINTPRQPGRSFVSTREVNSRFQPVFASYSNFNAVQSECFLSVYKSDDNVVVSAPTGSGKTVIFELAICRLAGISSADDYKIVYQAPTKALCSERALDWKKKFIQLGLKCAEVTGDSGTRQLSEIRESHVIITTPEKWDSMTRKWKDHAKLIRLVKLFLIDEVHMLKDERGATLEAVVARMKSIGGNVRFIALSATVPNSIDIATWLGRNSSRQDGPAKHQRFGEEFRPVALQKHVCAYQNHCSNLWAFDKTLDSKYDVLLLSLLLLILFRLPEVIQKYSERKPIIVFCATRKAATEAAKSLAKWWLNSEDQHRYWNAPRTAMVTSNPELQGSCKNCHCDQS